MRSIISMIIIMTAAPVFAQANDTATVQRAVRNALRDPSSARFLNMRIFQTTDVRGNPAKVACGTVSARTGAGGPSQGIPYVYLFKTGRFHFAGVGIGLNDSVDRQLGPMVYGNFCGR